MAPLFQQTGERSHAGAADGDHVDIQRRGHHNRRGVEKERYRGGEAECSIGPVMILRRSTLTLVALALVAFAGFVNAQEAKAPQTIVAASVVDVGRIAKGETIEHTFEIRNEGDAPLEITRVKPTCGCTVAEYDEVIEPGAVGSLRAKLDTSEFRGPIAKSIRVFTNDAGNPELTLVIKADVQAQIDISPGYARFVVVHGENYGTRKQIVWSPDHPQLELIQATSPYPFVEVAHRKLEPGDSDYRKDANRWQVDVTLASDAPVGPMADYIRLTTNHPRQKVVRIPISGFVRPILSVTPQVADFGRRTPGEAHTATLEVKNLSSMAVDVESATSDLEGLTAEVEAVEAGRLFNVVLTLEPGMEKGRFRGKVTLKTSSPKQPIVEIDVTGTVM